ncbi:hypothetical protein MHTCC0001_31370 [Flavobacteriaceae bacterium MHTCC 0001]
MSIFITRFVFFVFLAPFLAVAQITYESAFPQISFSFPVEIQAPNDNTDRLFVVEQEGVIKVFPRNSNVTSNSVTTFLDIKNKVSFANGQEIGLLGFAFHPNFNTNGYFYVYYTAPTSAAGGVSIKMVLSRFSVSNSNNNIANADSELILFQFDKNQNNSNHNGGKIAFGPDGYLYISIGDGGGANDHKGNAQDINTPFGSMLRIDVDLDGNNPVETNPLLPNGNYEIPSDNPFANSNGLDEIYAYGIRNTWKFSFDKSNGTLWSADVGQGTYEEINIIEKGKNYGWKRFEGNIVSNNVTVSGSTELPVFFYGRSSGDRSVTGGYVYRGSEITSLSPDINAKYIFGDYVSGRVWALNYNPINKTATSTLLFKTSGQFISTFGQDSNGELYFADYNTAAKLYKLVDGTTPSPATAINGIGTWSNLQQGISGTVNAIDTSPNGNVYVGGTFNTAGNSSANNIAMWNTSTGWQTFGSGANGTVNAIKLAPNGNLYVGGAFTEINDVALQNIAMWNGNNWTALGSGIDGTIAAIELDTDGNLYVGGIFETIGNTTVRNIAKWDGNSWNALTDATNNSSGTNNEIRALAVDQNNILYVGGNFDEAGDNTANRIATWDGTNWSSLGTGTSGFVEAIAINGNDVYLGGNFAIAGGLTANRLARWNTISNTWSTVENGVSNLVSSLLHDGTNLYIAGAFDFGITASENFILNNISQYNSSNGYTPLGTNTNVGVDIRVNAMAFSKDSDGTNKIYIGGNFNSSGPISVNNIAAWNSDNLLKVNDTTTNYVIPNPTNDIITLKFKTKWTLFSSLGQILTTGNSKSIDLNPYKSGMYWLVTDGKEVLKVLKN